MNPEHEKLYDRLDNLCKWTRRLAIAVLIVAFFFPEPWNEFTLYVALALFGVSLFLWGLQGVLTRRIFYENVENLVDFGHEIEGWKAVFVGLLAIIFSLMFMIAGIALAIEIFLFGAVRP